MRDKNCVYSGKPFHVRERQAWNRCMQAASVVCAAEDKGVLGDCVLLEAVYRDNQVRACSLRAYITQICSQTGKKGKHAAKRASRVRSRGECWLVLAGP